MEATLQYLTKAGITWVVIPNLEIVDNEIVRNNPKPDYNGQHYSYMNVNEFAEFLYGIINDGLMIDVDNFKVQTLAENVTPKGTEMLFTHKYKMIRVATPTVISNKTLASILSHEQINYLKDEYIKYQLNKNIKALESKIETFLSTQSSFDDTSEFKRALEILRA